MDRLIIQGGQTLKGSVRISGAKNSALALIAGTLLGDGVTELRNVPDLLDVRVIAEVLGHLGAGVTNDRDGRLVIDARGVVNHVAPYDLVTKMRASFFVLGPILARLGKAKIPLPGGCAIGSRPVDLHLKGLRALGATVQIEHGFVEATADRLYGAHIYLDYPSVGATENIMMAATLAHGMTVLENCAQEPEIVDLADMLNAMGANIRGAGTETIVIQGVERLGGCLHTVIPDRIEAGTMMMAAAITRSETRIEGVRLDHMQAVVSKLSEAGILIQPDGPDSVIVKGHEDMKPVDVRTMPYPGFPTDLQAPMMALLSTIPGTSMISETVFENRFLHVDELLRMGANIKTEGNAAVILGTRRLTGAPVKATDLRAGAALIIAALAAEGESQIAGLHHIDRGYESIEAKFRGAGVKLTRSTVADPLAVTP
ncbi:MAG: UDP-N-acetylglucosamine 1-carboxyvinyltransferase [Candidatus Sericytochromatia bacterium]|nr:UDP-N-acetylglucosamine 1-carboxyvinyltransferase [Candidatus Sericytochromatia bacterium]